MTEFFLILQAINASLTVANEIQPLIEPTKRWIGALFTSGVISAEQQDRAHAFCDAHMQARLRGEKPPELVVDPD